MKVACFYDGFRPRTGHRHGYECIDKKYVVGFEDASEFYAKKERSIQRHYDLMETDCRLISGDGAGWVKRFFHETESVCYMQLDPYHRNKALIEAGLKGAEYAAVSEPLFAGDIDTCLRRIKAIMQTKTSDTEKSKLLNLYEYYNANKDFLVPILERDVRLPKLPAGVEYRKLGTMESSIGNIAARRMKGRKAAFSRAGAERLARIIGHKLSRDLQNKIINIPAGGIPVKHIESVAAEPYSVLPASAIKQVIGKGYEPKDINVVQGVAAGVIKDMLKKIIKDKIPL
jgi:hypothetical protein